MRLTLEHPSFWDVICLLSCVLTPPVASVLLS